MQKLPDDDRRAEHELDLRIESLIAVWTIKGYGSLDSELSASRALELCRRPGTAWKDLWLALRGLSTSAITRPHLHKAHELVAEMVALAERHDSAAHLAQALGARAFANAEAGAFEPAMVDFDWATVIFDSTPMVGQEEMLGPTINPATARALSAWTQCFLGYLDQALTRIDSATTIAREADSRSILESVHNFALSVFDSRCEFERMRERAEATVALSAELGNPYRRARA